MTSNDPSALRAILEDATSDELEKRRSNLDYLVQGLMLEGGEVPEDLQHEFIAVQDEIARRAPVAKKVSSWTQLLGTTMHGYTVNHLLSDGTFAFVMRGTSENGTNAVFKYAKSDLQSINTKVTLERPFPTLALNIGPFEGKPITPSPDAVLQAQVELLLSNRHSSLLAVQDCSKHNGNTYYRSPLLDGFSLRHLMIWEKDTLETMVISVFTSICDSLHDLKQGGSFPYHGDVKPDNILVTESGITLIDPGFFGELACVEGQIEAGMVSTPAYYPLWEPDDIFAVGICLYEAVLSVHPFNPLPVDGKEQAMTISEEVQQIVYFRQSLLQESLTPLLYLKRPTTLRPELSLEMEAVILKGLKLKALDDGLLYADPGFADFLEFSKALSALKTDKK